MDKKSIFLCTLIIFVKVLVIAGIMYNNKSASAQPGIAGTAQTDESTAPGDTQADDSSEAPNFYFTDYEGNRVMLASFEGKPLILNFWASWCGPCKSEMPDLEEAYKTYGDQIHFIMLNLTDGSIETVEKAKAYMESQDYTFPVYFDTQQYGAYFFSVNAIPVTYFIDAQGNVAGMYAGSMDANILQQGIDLLLP